MFVFTTIDQHDNKNCIIIYQTIINVIPKFKKVFLSHKCLSTTCTKKEQSPWYTVDQELFK